MKFIFWFLILEIDFLILENNYFCLQWLAILFVSFRFDLFRFVLFRFVLICFVPFRSVSFRFDLFRFVSICFVSFRFVSVSFRTLQGPLKFWVIDSEYIVEISGSVVKHIHRVQRLMSSKGAKRWTSDDITWFPKYFWQMTIARSEDINKDDASILNLFKKLLVSANTSVQFYQRKFE